MPVASHDTLRFDAPAGRSRQPSVAWSLLAAGLFLVALAATWVVAALVPAAHLRDATILYDFMQLSRPRVDRVANGVLGLLEPSPFILWGTLLVAVALVRRRPRLALAVALVLTLAPLTAELLKPLLAHQHAYVGLQYVDAASWPSGHATAATVLSLCAVLVSPRWLRPAVAASGLVFLFAVGCSLLVLAWHMPSDVVGGYLLASLWVSLAVFVLRATERRWPSRRRLALAGAGGGVRGGRRVRGGVRTGLPQ